MIHFSPNWGSTFPFQLILDYALAISVLVTRFYRLLTGAIKRFGWSNSAKHYGKIPVHISLGDCLATWPIPPNFGMNVFALASILLGKSLDLTRTAIVNGVLALSSPFKSSSGFSARERLLVARRLRDSSSVRRAPLLFSGCTPLLHLPEHRLLEGARSVARSNLFASATSHTGSMFPKPYASSLDRSTRLLPNALESARSFFPEDQWWRIVPFDMPSPDAGIDWTQGARVRAPGDITSISGGRRWSCRTRRHSSISLSRGARGGENITKLVRTVVPSWVDLHVSRNRPR